MEVSLKEPLLLNGSETLLLPMLFPSVLGLKWETGAGDTSLLSINESIPKPGAAIMTAD